MQIRTPTTVLTRAPPLMRRLPALWEKEADTASKVSSRFEVLAYLCYSINGVQADVCTAKKFGIFAHARIWQYAFVNFALAPQTTDRRRPLARSPAVLVAKTREK